MSDIKKYLEILNEDGPGARWRQEAGNKGPTGLGKTFVKTVTDYGDRTMKEPIGRDGLDSNSEPITKSDPLSGRDKLKLSTKGEPLTPRNAGRNLKNTIKSTLGTHGTSNLPEGEEQGASAEEVARAIAGRISRQRLDLVSAHGVEAVMDAVDQVAQFYAGAEELGSSDISIMVKEVERQLIAGKGEDDRPGWSDPEWKANLNKMTGFSDTNGGVEEDATDPRNLDMTDLDYSEMNKEPLDFTEAMREEWEQFTAEAAKKSPNRELWDQIRSRGVVPSIDRERYTDLSHEGLEGPFRAKNGQVLYYDPKAGQYYNRDSDMYISQQELDQINRYGLEEEQVDELSNKPGGVLDRYMQKADNSHSKGINKAFNKLHNPGQVKVPAKPQGEVVESDPSIPMDAHLAQKERDRQAFRDAYMRRYPQEVKRKADQAAAMFYSRNKDKFDGQLNEFGADNSGSVNAPSSQGTNAGSAQPAGQDDNELSDILSLAGQKDAALASKLKTPQAQDALNKMNQSLEQSGKGEQAAKTLASTLGMIAK